MTELELFVSEQIKMLVSNYSTIELKATVTSNSFSVEFFAKIGERKMQSFEMIDEGMFSEKQFKVVAKKLANYFRSLSNFNKEGLNKYTVVLK